MNMRMAVAAYLTLWAAIATGVVYGFVWVGYPWWAGLVVAYLSFVFLNGSLGYVARRRQLAQLGQAPPPYLKYLFFPKGIPSLKEQAPKDMHFLTSFLSAVAGAFLLFCGVALTIDAEWSRITNPALVVVLCLIPTSIGGALVYGAWRIFAAGRRAPSNVA